jgi:hypothetical protein
MLSTTEQYQEEWGKNYRKEHTLDFWQTLENPNMG